jgi:hypothetical protein
LPRKLKAATFEGAQVFHTFGSNLSSSSSSEKLTSSTVERLSAKKIDLTE